MKNFIPLLFLILFFQAAAFAQGSTGKSPKYTWFRTLSGETVGTPVGSLFFKSLTGGGYAEGAAMRVMAAASEKSGFMPMNFVFETGDTELVERFRINADGKIGVNVSSPLARFHLASYLNQTGSSESIFRISGGASISPAEFDVFQHPTENDHLLATLEGEFRVSRGDVFVEDKNVEIAKGKLLVREDNVEVHRGKLLVNTNEEIGEHQVLINGSIIATEAWIKEYPNWPDYVFAPEYELMPLKDLKAYIEEHGHLPEIPTALEVEEKGFAMGEMQSLLLKKVEELTLHLLEERKARLILEKNLENLNELLQELISNSK